MKQKQKKKDQVSIQLTGKQLAILIFGIFLISGLSFGFGVLLINKFTSPSSPLATAKNTLKTPAASKKAPLYKQKIEKSISSAPQKKSQNSLTFFNTLPDKTTPPKTQKKPQQKQNKPSPVTTQTKPVAEKRQKTAKIQEQPPLQAPIVENKRTGTYTVQVVSYRSENYAEKLASTLLKKGYDAYISKADIPKKGTYYRVRVGDYADKDTAAKAANTLFTKEEKELKIKKPIVIMRYRNGSPLPAH